MKVSDLTLKRLDARLLHEVLVDIRDNGAEFQEAGICYNVDMHDRVHGTRGHHAVTRLLRVLVATWPERCRGTLFDVSGFDGPRAMHDGRFYPVGGLDEYDREQEDGTLWHNPRRIALLEYLIKRTEELSHEC